MEDDDETSESSNVSTEKPSEAEKLQVKYLQLENRVRQFLFLVKIVIIFVLTES